MATPRTLDLDILLCGELTLNESNLIVPHPRIIERAFVLIPLVEISPDLTHPLWGMTVTRLLEGLVYTDKVENIGTVDYI